jgi:hypothetical protein
LRRRSNKTGFVLILVLVVLAIAGVVLGSAAARGGRDAIRASTAERDLQLRWGNLSCRTAVLPLAQQMLQSADGTDGNGLPRKTFSVCVTRRITLAGVDFDLVISDEQAKANVNLLFARGGAGQVEASVAELQSDQSRALPLLLRPQAGQDRAIRKYPLELGSYEQVFVVKHPRELVESGFDELAGQKRVTCWGSGRVNFKAADVPVLRQILAGVLTETQFDELVKYRSAQPDCTLEEALRKLKLTKEKGDDARKLLCEESSCQSLWVIARCKTRDWYTLHVVQAGDAENDAQSWTFRW